MRYKPARNLKEHIYVYVKVMKSVVMLYNNETIGSNIAVTIYYLIDNSSMWRGVVDDGEIHN